MIEQQRKKGFLILSLVLVLGATLYPTHGYGGALYIDKVVHFSLFFILSLSINYTFENKKELPTALILGMFLGVITEVLQRHIPGRLMDAYDILADDLGFIFGYLLYQSKSNFIVRTIQKLGS